MFLRYLEVPLIDGILHTISKKTKIGPIVVLKSEKTQNLKNCRNDLKVGPGVHFGVNNDFEEKFFEKKF